MKISSITNNYSNPYFGSVNYRREKNVSPTTDKAVRTSLKSLADNQNCLPNNAMLKLLALGFQTTKGSANDYPVDVTITNHGAIVRMPIVEAIEEENNFDNEDIYLDDDFETWRDELADKYGDDYVAGDDYETNYKSNWKLTWDKNGNNYYEVNCNKPDSKVRNYDEIIYNAFLQANEQQIRNENEFLSELLDEGYLE